jgi:hypothetical protein
MALPNMEVVAKFIPIVWLAEEANNKHKMLQYLIRRDN